jgi:DNA polymerase-3 subunit delta'
MAGVATFAPALLGHQWMMDFLERALRAGATTHAYLLTGPPQVGKFTTALAIARLLLCPTIPSCGACRHCRLVERRGHPDLRVLERPPDRKTIPLRDVHEFMHGMALKPMEAERKVYILRGAEDLAEEGANALLKTIEEPPPAVTLVLTAPSSTALLPTIVSRCQVAPLRPVSAEEIAAYLREALGVEGARAEAIARASKGRPGWAILAAKNADLYQERGRHGSDLLGLLKAHRLDRIRYADALADRWAGHPEDVREVLEAWMDLWRESLLHLEGVSGSSFDPDLAAKITAAADSLAGEAVRRALQATLDTAEGLERNANARLALEAYALLLPRLR